MSTITIALFDLWALRWEELLTYRRDLLHWKRVLSAAERDYQRTGLDGYLDEIRSAKYAIQQLDYHIAELKAKLNNDDYSPYEILQLPQDASGRAIFEAYRCLRREAHRICQKWVSLRDSADTQTKKVIFAHNLEKAEFVLRQIELAYDRLKSLRPCYPGPTHHKKLLGRYANKHHLLKLHPDHRVFSRNLNIMDTDRRKDDGSKLGNLGL